MYEERVPAAHAACTFIDNFLIELLHVAGAGHPDATRLAK